MMKKIFGGKKGVQILFIVFELLIVLFVIFTLVKIAESYGSTTGTQKAILSKDLKMMVDTLVATPGDVVVEYPGDVSSYQFHLFQDHILVALYDEDKGFGISNYFSLPKGYKATGSVMESEKLCFVKQNKHS